MHLAPLRPALRTAVGLLALALAVLAPTSSPAQQATPRATRRPADPLAFANALLRDRRYDLAAEEYERYLANGPDAAGATVAHFGLANARLALNQLKDARRQFEAFLEVAPDHAEAPTAWYRAGETAYMLGDLAGARRALETYTGRYPTHRFLDMGWPYLGDVCFALKDYDAARKAYERALTDFPDGRLVDRTRYGLARTLAAQGETAEALRLLDELIARKSPEWSEKARFQRGELNVAAGRLDAAVAAYEELERESPRSLLLPEARLHRAEALLKLSRPDDAEPLLRELAGGSGPLAAQAAYLLGGVQLDRGQADRALATWDDARARAPDGPRAPMLLFRTGQALMALKRPADARARFEKVADQFPKDAWADDALLRAATLALEANDPAAARSLAGSLPTRFPDSNLRADARLIEARAALAQNKPTEAIPLLDAVIADEQAGTQTAQAARYHLGLAYKASGQGEKSAAVLNDLAQMPAAPLANNAQFLVGQGHFEAGRHAEAIPALEQYLAGKPRGDVAANALAYLAVARAEVGKDDESAAALDQLANDAPNSPALAWARLRLGERDLAAKRYDRAVERLDLVADADGSKYRVQALSDLGWSQLGAGRPAEAAAAFGRLLEIAPDDPLAPEAALARASALDRADDADAALAAYDLVAEKYAKSDQAGPAALARARLLVRLGRADDAGAAFEHYLKEFPQGEPADAVLAEWGNALVAAGKPAEADAVFARLLEQHPDSLRAADARLNLAASAYEAGRVDEVITLLEPLTAAGTTLEPALAPRVFYQLGLAHLKRKEWPAAAALFGRVADEFPDSPLRPVARFWKAECAYQTGDPAAAEAGFAALLAEPPADPAAAGWLRTARLRRIQSLVNLERWSDALSAADALKSEVPDFAPMAEVDYARGRALQAQGRLDDALAAYQAVVDAPRTDPDLAARAQWMRGEALFHKPDYREALKEFLKVDYLHPKAPRWRAAALLEAGKVCERLDRWSDAVKLYAKLADEYPDDPRAAEASKRLEAARARAPAPAGATP